MDHREPTSPKITLDSVAREAGVHRATAAVVLNGARGGTVVSDETRRRVQTAAARLGYRPNRAAQTLRRQRSMTIGLAAGPIRNPFFSEMAALCERFLVDAGYDLVVAMEAARTMDERTFLEKLCARGVDGVIFWSECDTEGRRFVEEGIGCPVVLFGHPSPRVDSVTTDDALGARLAVERLLETGRRRICYLSPTGALGLWSGKLRLQSFCDAAGAGGVSPAVRFYDSIPGDMKRAREAAEEIGRSGDCPDGLVCFNDMVAIGAMMGLRRAGRRVPEDVAVIGFDNIPLAAELDVPLTTIDLPLADVCERAVTQLLARLDGTASGPPQEIHVQPRLLVRASTLGR